MSRAGALQAGLESSSWFAASKVGEVFLLFGVFTYVAYGGAVACKLWGTTRGYSEKVVVGGIVVNVVPDARFLVMRLYGVGVQDGIEEEWMESG